MGPRTKVSAARPSGRSISAARDSDEFAALVRLLAAAGNVRILGTLAKARRADPDGGWMFLSEIAEAVGEAPGSVGLAIEKLKPLLDERREKGRRWFRTRVRDVTLTLDEVR